MRRFPALAMANSLRTTAWFVAGSGALLILAGCGSGGGPTTPTGNTLATLMLTATDNAQIPVFKINLQGVSLVASDGTTVALLTTPQTVELGSLNGVARPLATTSVPQGTLYCSQFELRVIGVRCDRLGQSEQRPEQRRPVG